MQKLWMDGDLVDPAEAAASPLSHALHYGTGVFEGIRAYETRQGPAIFRLDEHLERLGRGAAALDMPVDLPLLRRGCLDAMAASGLTEAYIRPLAFYETGGLSLDVAGLRVRHFVGALPWKNHLGDPGARGVRVRTSPWRRNPASALPPLKLCGNYVNSILAKLEATKAGFEEALFIDGQGLVVECTGENVFMVKAGKVTSVQHRDALPGITRATVMDLCGAGTREVSLAELKEADEVFVTGTSAEVTTVAPLDDRVWAVGPVTRDLQSLYLDVVRGRNDAHGHWLTPVAAQAVR
jgi:branched-chain amino acid aminotransferase